MKSRRSFFKKIIGTVAYVAICPVRSLKLHSTFNSQYAATVLPINKPLILSGKEIPMPQPAGTIYYNLDNCSIWVSDGEKFLPLEKLNREC